MAQRDSGRTEAAALGIPTVSPEQHSPIIGRLADEKAIPEEEALVYFVEMLRFLDLAYTTNEPLTPSKVVDDAWHTFMLFSREYTRYCEERFGRYIHHEPDDRERGGSGPGYEGTRKLAEAAFGTLDERAWPQAESATCAAASNRTSECKSGAGCASEGTCTSECKSAG